MLASQFGFGVESVHMAWPTVHEQVDDPLGLAGEMGAPWLKRIQSPGLVGCQKRGEPQATHAHTHATKPLAAAE